MSALTACDLRTRNQVLLRPIRVVRVVCLLAVLGALASLQVALRFQIRDFQIETGELQKTRKQLAGRRNALLSEVEGLKRGERLRLRAEIELGLRECPPERSHKAAVARRAVERWQDWHDRLARDRAAASTTRVGRIVAIGEKIISLPGAPGKGESEPTGSL